MFYLFIIITILYHESKYSLKLVVVYGINIVRLLTSEFSGQFCYALMRDCFH